MKPPQRIVPHAKGTGADLPRTHAATAVGSTWTAAYDAAGDMTCRAATGANSCAGNSPNGSPLTWDTEGRLIEWTSPTGAPWASAIDLYDGEGNRAQQRTVVGGVVTQTTISTTWRMSASPT